MYNNGNTIRLYLYPTHGRIPAFLSSSSKNTSQNIISQAAELRSVMPNYNMMSEEHGKKLVKTDFCGQTDLPKLRNEKFQYMNGHTELVFVH